jgi:hypothetical protein
VGDGGEPELDRRPFIETGGAAQSRSCSDQQVADLSGFEVLNKVGDDQRARGKMQSTTCCNSWPEPRLRS